MTTLIGFVIGVVCTSIIIGMMAGIAFFMQDMLNPYPAFAGIAAGVVVVLAVVGWLA